MRDCDVLILGAGPAGCATAMRTARAGLMTFMVERPGAARCWAGESLPPGAETLVRQLFGPDILSETLHMRAVGTRSVWGSEDLAATDFIMNPLGGGWMLDRVRFDADLRGLALAAGSRLLEAGRLETAAPLDGGGWILGFGGGQEVRAGFVVDASGRSRGFLRKRGIGQRRGDRQIAVVASFADEGDAFRGTTVEAVEEGWWYTTPLPGGRRVLAYLTDDDLWRGSAARWDALLCATEHMLGCVGDGARQVLPAAYPASTTVSATICGQGWLAVGDAAAAFDPLASQGIQTALLMGREAGNAIAHPRRSESLEEWSGAYALLVAEHAAQRAHFSRLETRWPASPFWRRRARAPRADSVPGSWGSFASD